MVGYDDKCVPTDNRYFVGASNRMFQRRTLKSQPFFAREKGEKAKYGSRGLQGRPLKCRTTHQRNSLLLNSWTDNVKTVRPIIDVTTQARSSRCERADQVVSCWRLSLAPSPFYPRPSSVNKFDTRTSRRNAPRATQRRWGHVSSREREPATRVGPPLEDGSNQ